MQDTMETQAARRRPVGAVDTGGCLRRVEPSIVIRPEPAPRVSLSSVPAPLRTIPVRRAHLELSRVDRFDAMQKGAQEFWQWRRDSELSQNKSPQRRKYDQLCVGSHCTSFGESAKSPGLDRASTG